VCIAPKPSALGRKGPQTISYLLEMAIICLKLDEKALNSPILARKEPFLPKIP
jgi:hypothetical protein